MKTPKILHRDRSVVVIHKPAGMTVYREPGSEGVSALDWVKQKNSGSAFPVHRLDKGTCGVLLFALTPADASLVQKLFRENRVRKRYWAIVAGDPPTKGSWRNPLPEPKSKETRSAETAFRVLERIEAEGESYALVEVEPKTGRFHQIRRHFSMNGFPLLGDEKYSPISLVKWAGKVLHLKRPALSAVAISFSHPRSRQAITVESEPDADFESAWRKLRRLSEEAASKPASSGTD